MNSIVRKETESRLETVFHIRASLEDATENQRLNVLASLLFAYDMSWQVDSFPLLIGSNQRIADKTKGGAPAVTKKDIATLKMWLIHVGVAYLVPTGSSLGDPKNFLKLITALMEKTEQRHGTKLKPMIRQIVGRQNRLTVKNTAKANVLQELEDSRNLEEDTATIVYPLKGLTVPKSGSDKEEGKEENQKARHKSGEENTIPSGKTIPRTPNMHEGDTNPFKGRTLVRSAAQDDEAAVNDDDDAHFVKPGEVQATNRIPSGRGIQRTPLKDPKAPFEVDSDEKQKGNNVKPSEVLKKEREANRIPSGKDIPRTPDVGQIIEQGLSSIISAEITSDDVFVKPSDYPSERSRQNSGDKTINNSIPSGKAIPRTPNLKDEKDRSKAEFKFPSPKAVQKSPMKSPKNAIPSGPGLPRTPAGEKPVRSEYEIDDSIFKSPIIDPDEIPIRPKYVSPHEAPAEYAAPKRNFIPSGSNKLPRTPYVPQAHDQDPVQEDFTDDEHKTESEEPQIQAIHDATFDVEDKEDKVEEKSPRPDSGKSKRKRPEEETADQSAKPEVASTENDQTKETTIDTTSAATKVSPKKKRKTTKSKIDSKRKTKPSPDKSKNNLSVAKQSKKDVSLTTRRRSPRTLDKLDTEEATKKKLEKKSPAVAKKKSPAVKKSISPGKTKSLRAVAKVAMVAQKKAPPVSKNDSVNTTKTESKRTTRKAAADKSLKPEEKEVNKSRKNSKVVPDKSPAITKSSARGSRKASQNSIVEAAKSPARKKSDHDIKELDQGTEQKFNDAIDRVVAKIINVKQDKDNSSKNNKAPAKKTDDTTSNEVRRSARNRTLEKSSDDKNSVKLPQIDDKDERSKRRRKKNEELAEDVANITIEEFVPALKMKPGRNVSKNLKRISDDVYKTPVVENSQISVLKKTTAAVNGRAQSAVPRNTRARNANSKPSKVALLKTVDDEIYQTPAAVPAQPRKRRVVN